MALFVDKLKIANILVRGDVPREAAEELAEAIAETLESSATDDEVEQRIAALDAKTDTRFEAMMAQMDARFAQIDARMAQMEVRIYRAIGVATALIIAAMSAWAAFG